MFDGMRRSVYLLAIIFTFGHRAVAQMNTIWRMGNPDGSGQEFALSPSGYKGFMAPFGGENTVYRVGYSKPGKDWPYVLPGPLDEWAGGGYWSGSYPRHFPRIFFNLPALTGKEHFLLTLDFSDAAKDAPPLIRIDINGHRMEKQLSPGAGRQLKDSAGHGLPQSVGIDAPAGWFKEGLNVIRMGSIKGSWAIFDDIRLESDAPLTVTPSSGTLVVSAKAAGFEYAEGGKRVQPVLVDLYQLDTAQVLRFSVSGFPVQAKRVETGHSILEISLPAMAPHQAPEMRDIIISSHDVNVFSGTITRSHEPLHTYADYVDLLMGTGNSRWMFKPGPSLPLSMVQIAPDNQDQTWKAGYEYTIDNISGFSHFSDWTMCSPIMMPTGGPLQVTPGREDEPDSGYRSRIDKATESARIGKYSVFMTDTRIKAEITSTRRAAIQRYTFPAMDSARILLDLFPEGEYPHNLLDARVTKVSDTEIEGQATYYNAFTGYSLQQLYTVYFVFQFSKPFTSMGGWVNTHVPQVKGYIPNWKMDHEFSTPADIYYNIRRLNGKGAAGVFLNYKTTDGEVIEVRSGMSLVDMAGARNNLSTELTQHYGWNFDAVARHQKDVWNRYLGRMDIQTDDYLQKVKFYTNLYRAVAAKAIWSDADGRFTDEMERIRKLPDAGDCIVSGEYWTTFWDNQQLFNLVAPEISSAWARSSIALYKNSGWFNTDPAGIEETGVMVAMHMVSQIQGAWQSGIHDFDLRTAFTGLKKMLTVPPQRYAGGGTVGMEDIVPYERYGYVPQGMGAVSNTMEYAYDDWCLAQMANALHDHKDYRFFYNRSQNWRNIFDTVTGFVRPKTPDGHWVTPFDPFYTPGFVEGNAFNYSMFVPQDPASLVAAVGKDRFIERLNDAMVKSSAANFNASGDNFAEAPINHGNEPTMQAAYLFNWAGAPRLTQKWVRAIQEQYYGVTPYDAYPGDEDLGQMSSWFVMSAIGFFQMDGGCSGHPLYELGSPRYPRITIHLDGKYGRGNRFVIEARGASKDNKYVRSAFLNGSRLTDFRIPQQDVLKGGRLVLEMGHE